MLFQRSDVSSRPVALVVAAVLTAYSATASAETPKRIDLVDVKLIDPVQVTAKATVNVYGAEMVPGAIVCDNYGKTERMMWRYVTHATQEAEDRRSGGQSKLIRGEPKPLPDLASYGCVLVPAGHAMTWGRGNGGVPIVSAVAKDGTTVTGVTLLTMINTGR